MKTVRFSEIVAAAGRPHAHTLWVAPERDAEFKRARAAHRVMTIAHTAGKTDAGLVGFAPDRGASEFLIFPKSLAKFEGARVVGVKFDLVEQPKLGVAKTGAWQGPPEETRAKAKTTSKPKAKAHAKPGKLLAFPPPRDDTPETPEPEAAPAAKPKPPPKPKSPRVAKARAAAEAQHLAREIRAALQELEAGRSVAAYRRLARAIA